MTMIETPALAHISDWIFDLDNTLYPRECNLFEQIGVRINAYIMEVTGLDRDAAHLLQKQYYRDFGTSLNGLMQKHDVDPKHYLQTVHAIDYTSVPAHPVLVETLAALPGRKFILTNGDVAHARAVLARLGADQLFEVIYDIEAMGYAPKPARSAYEGFMGTYGIDPRHAAMFDDLDKNLVVPHELGMTTVQIIAGQNYVNDQIEPWELASSHGPHIHHMTSDLAEFLRACR